MPRWERRDAFRTLIARRETLLVVKGTLGSEAWKLVTARTPRDAGVEGY